MKVRLVFAVLVAAVSTSLVVLPGALAAPQAKAPAAAPTVAGVNVPINFASAAGTFDGVFNVTRFAVQNGQLTAIGTLTGTVNNLVTGVTGTISQALTLPVAGTAPTASCQILDLVLGPLHLDLLGLVVDLNQVHLNITAVPGAGNLLGNLLCAVAGLLDNTGGGTAGGALNGIAALLNNILRNL